MSSGVAHGDVHIVDRRQRSFPTRHIDQADVDDEIARLERAVRVATLSLTALKSKVITGGHEEHSAILDAHLLMMKDPMLLAAAHKEIRENNKCAEWALRSTVQSIKRAFEALGDSYFRERRSDVDFVGERLLAAMGNESATPLVLPPGCVVVTHALSPADTLRLLRGSSAAGFVTETGGATGHTAILARALGIPAVVGCEGILEHAGDGDEVLVDSQNGEVILSPEAEQTARYDGRRANRQRLEDLWREQVNEPAITVDGHSLSLLANIERAADVGAALAHGAAGVGLYRTEMRFLEHDKATLEEIDHARDATELLSQLAPGMPCYVRTLDLGSDKLSEHLRLPSEDNPALGLRGVRLMLARPELMRAQLKGILRAMSTLRRGSLLIPMVCSVDEMIQVRAMVEDVCDTLEEDGVNAWREVPIGAMIEVPAAVWIADHLAKVCDFFSIGTNDLIQYTLGVDRGNGLVGHLYRPLHLGHLRALQMVTSAAHAAQIPVSLCGEMAADPSNLALLLGLGLGSISMPAGALPRARWVLRRLKMSDATAALTECLGADDDVGAREIADRVLKERAPELFD